MIATKRARTSKSQGCENCEHEDGGSLAYNDRNIFISGEISANTWDGFSQVFTALEKEKGPITIIINSQGGSLWDGMAMYDLIRASKNHTTIIGHGLVMSAATMIMQAANKRLLGANSNFMIHESRQGLSNEFKEMDLHQQYQEAVRGNNIIYKVLAERSIYTVEEVKTLCQRDYFMSAKEAVKQGFADAIVPVRKR
jgi:ATP-dependent Clp protease protease subunit